MIEVYKKRYQTCLELLEQLREETPSLKDEVLSYNGILDPMAEGIVPVLVGSDENKRRGEYTGSKKIYRVEVLVGISTDSDDLLGIVENFSVFNTTEIKDSIVSSFCSHTREFSQTVPMHSNRKVDGKRLWWWKLNGVDIPVERRPVNEVKLFDVSFLKERNVTVDDLQKDVSEMREKFGDRFRIEEVSRSWDTLLEKSLVSSFLVLEFELFVSSGFYVRTFVREIARSLGIPLLVHRLVRTKVVFN